MASAIGTDRHCRRVRHGALRCLCERSIETSGHWAHIGLGTVWNTVQLLRCFSHASIGVRSEELFDPVELRMWHGPSPSWPFRFQGTSAIELVKWSPESQPCRKDENGKTVFGRLYRTLCADSASRASSNPFFPYFEKGR